MKKKFNFLWKGLLLLTCCLFVASITFAQNNQWGKWCYTDYTSPGTKTFTVPEGTTKIYFEAVGAGGAGGFVKSDGEGCLEELRMSNYYQVSGGGGGGAYGRSDTIFNPASGETFTIYVGAGGRNTAGWPSTGEFLQDFDWCWDALTVADRWKCHTLYRKCWNAPWIGHMSWNGIDWIQLPFFKDRNQTDGETSYVKKGSSTILEAYGGMSVHGDNNLNGAQGGAAAGVGAFHAAGGKGGNAIKDCPGIVDRITDSWLKDDMWGQISAGGGAAAGNPWNYDDRHGEDASCSAETGFGHAGKGYCYQMFGNTGDVLDGYGGEGTSDWAWDADGHNGSHGDPGHPKGGGGGGSKIGIAGWCNGGDGGDGFVRVWFYIDAPALSVNPTANGANPLNLSEPGNVNLNAGANNLNSGFSTQYKWNPSGKTTNPITESVSSTTTYYVTVTNISTIATNSDACSVTNSGQVKINVDEINAGTIAANNANWVCTPGDTVVTITSTAPGTPAGGNYTWQYSSNGSSWSPVTDAYGAPATGAEYTVINTTGYYRRGYAKGSVGPVYTSPVHVTRPSDINPGTIKDNNNGTTTNVCSGGNVSVNLSATTSYPVTWQTSTDGTNWTNYTGSVTPLTFNGLTTTTYVRYLAQYSSSANPCYVPSNNYYKLNVWEKPVVNDITAPADKCPSLSSYPLTGDVIEGSSSSLTYHWGGDADATVTTNPGRIIPTTPNCNKSYSYSLYVTDGNTCTSNTVTKNNGFKTDNPTWSYSGAEVAAVNPGDHTGNCIFTIPTNTVLKAAVDAVINTTCGNEVNLTYPNVDMEPGDPITETQYIPVTATDMCGASHDITIHVVVPDAPTVTIAPAEGSQQFVCPGNTTTLRATTTAEEPQYQWYPNSLGTNQTATTIAYNGEDVTAHSDYYTVVVTDKYGCTSTGNFTVYTTPKAYIAAKEYTICSDKAATMSLVSDDKVPTGNSAISSLTFNYNTTYTWTISTPNTNITGATEATTAQTNFTTGDLFNATLEMQTIVYTVTPTTSTSIDGTVVNSCDGAPFTVTVNVKPKVTNTGAIDPFDDADVIITLWYGACDTLYYVNTPTYTNNILPDDLLINLTNDKGNTVNEGTLLGRIAPGEYTIRWTFTDECNNSIYFDKKYIVRYPNCGDADPNYTEPYIAVDADGNEYHTVRIGCECWTASNLKTVTGAANSMVYKCNDYPNETENEEKYGRLYTWYTAVNVPEGDNTTEPTVSIAAYSTYPYVHGICPTGWAIPSTENFTSMVGIAGGVNAVKSSSNLYWLPGAEGSDASGFGARGAGYYDSSAERFMNLMGETYFWTYETSSSYGGKCAVISYYCPELLIQDKLKGMGYSIRCIRRENP